jgi:outer membrane receptor for ferrienterochelin and colicin
MFRTSFSYIRRELLIKILLTVFVNLMFLQFSFSQKIDSSFSAYNYSLRELQNIKTTTGSLKAENIDEAPSNITIITEQMITERGYQTLVDVCQDIPGFDFKVFNEGSGDYPT